MVYLGTVGRPRWLEHSKLRVRGVGYEVKKVGKSHII